MMGKGDRGGIISTDNHERLSEGIRMLEDNGSEDPPTYTQNFLHADPPDKNAKLPPYGIGNLLALMMFLD